MSASRTGRRARPCHHPDGARRRPTCRHRHGRPGARRPGHHPDPWHQRLPRPPAIEDGAGTTTRTPVRRSSPAPSSSCEAANPNTVFAAAGDLIGASTFESFIQHDKPTLDALNEAGLDVSAAGNHEFDPGYDDLVNRVMSAEDAGQPRGRCRLAVPRRQRPQEVRQLLRPPRRGGLPAPLDRTGLRRRPGRLRRCGHRGPALARQPRRHRRHQGDQHRQRGQPQRDALEDRGRRRRRAARARGCA